VLTDTAALANNMGLKKLAEQGREYLSQLEDERKFHILQNNEQQRKLAETLWEEIFKDDSTEQLPQQKTDDPE
jgi:hypothetical protein